MSAVILACTVCSAPAKLKCGGCHGARYCSEKCQKINWLKHKKFCGQKPTLKRKNTVEYSKKWTGFLGPIVACLCPPGTKAYVLCCIKNMETLPTMRVINFVNPDLNFLCRCVPNTDCKHRREFLELYHNNWVENLDDHILGTKLVFVQQLTKLDSITQSNVITEYCTCTIKNVDI